MYVQRVVACDHVRPCVFLVYFRIPLDDDLLTAVTMAATDVTAQVVDGVSRTLNRLVNDLQSRGYRVLVLAPYADPPALEHYGMLLPVPALTIPFRPEYSAATGIDQCTREVLEEHNPSIVHIATPDYLGQSDTKTNLPCRHLLVHRYPKTLMGVPLPSSLQYIHVTSSALKGAMMCGATCH